MKLQSLSTVKPPEEKKIGKLHHSRIIYSENQPKFQELLITFILINKLCFSGVYTPGFWIQILL